MKQRPVMGAMLQIHNQFNPMVVAPPPLPKLSIVRKRGRKHLHYKRQSFIDTFISQDLIEHMTATQRLATGTIRTRVSRIRTFLRWLKENPAELNERTIELFFYHLKTETKMTGSSLNTYIPALISYEKYLHDRQGQEQFISGFHRFRQEDPNIVPLTVEEAKQLKDFCFKSPGNSAHRTHMELILFLIDTGARWEDGQGLICENVDLVSKQISYRQLKTGKIRIVHIEEPLLSILVKRTEDRQPNDLVFANSFDNNLAYHDFFYALKNTARALDIKKRVSPHVLRHSYAQNLYDQTGDIYLVKDVIGHKSINSTMRYLRNSGKRVKEAQMLHPHLENNIPPDTRIRLIRDNLESIGLENDDRFDREAINRAINNFVNDLNRAIR